MSGQKSVTIETVIGDLHIQNSSENLIRLIYHDIGDGHYYDKIIRNDSLPKPLDILELLYSIKNLGFDIEVFNGDIISIQILIDDIKTKFYLSNLGNPGGTGFNPNILDTKDQNLTSICDRKWYVQNNIGASWNIYFTSDDEFHYFVLDIGNDLIFKGKSIIMGSIYTILKSKSSRLKIHVHDNINARLIDDEQNFDPVIMELFDLHNNKPKIGKCKYHDSGIQNLLNRNGFQSY